MNVSNSVHPASQTSLPASEAELEATFEQLQHELRGLLYHMLGNAEDARDALQDTFIKCWKHRERVPEVRRIRSWIFTIALNTAKDMRQSAWRRRKEALVDGGTQVAATGEDAPARMQREEQLAHLRDAIGNLREQEKEVFLLRQNGELTYDEIAAALQIPPGTVKTRMRLAISKLRLAVK